MMALVNAVAAPKLRWLVAAVVPAVVCYVVVGILASYVSGFIVKPNELVRETPYIANNIELTRQAYSLDRIVRQPFPAETTIEAVDLAQESGRRFRTSGCGTGGRSRTRCGRFRRSAPTTNFLTSTSIAT